MAKSNSQEDQAVKYVLRDEIMPQIYGLVQNCKTPEEAQNLLVFHQSEIQSAATAILEKYEYKEGVLVEICDFRYDRRVLGGKIYPAGVYPSLRIVIGEGQGQNLTE